MKTYIYTRGIGGYAKGAEREAQPREVAHLLKRGILIEREGAAEGGGTKPAEGGGTKPAPKPEAKPAPEPETKAAG